MLPFRGGSYPEAPPTYHTVRPAEIVIQPPPIHNVLSFHYYLLRGKSLKHSQVFLKPVLSGLWRSRLRRFLCNCAAWRRRSRHTKR